MSEASDEFIVGSIGTGVENTTLENNISVIGGKGIISVRGIETATDINIYGINGTLVRSLEVYRNASLSVPAGQYILKTNNSVFKVLVY